MGISSRQSAPPPPPAAFDDGNIPKSLEQVAAQNKELLTDHARLKSPANNFENKLITNGIPGPAGSIHEIKVVNDAKYPAWRYHRTKAPNGIIVKDAEIEAEVCAGKGWFSRPIPSEAADSAYDRLCMLDRIMKTLGEVAEPDEEVEEVLARIIKERDRFARAAAMKIQVKGMDHAGSENTAA